MPVPRSNRVMPVMLLLFLLSMMVPGHSSGDSQDSLDNIQVLSNAYKPIELKGFDRNGDTVHITLSHKAIQGKEVRPVNLYIVDELVYDRFNFYRQSSEDPSTYTRYSKINVSSRFETDYRCIWNQRTYLILDNPYHDGDEHDTLNSTAILRLDYTVTDASSSEASPLLMYLLIILVALIIAGLIVAGIILYKRRKTDRRSFFIKGNFLYYALQGPDGNIFYYGPEQYDRMYKSGTLTGFQFLGYTREIGGEIYNESGIMVNPSAYSPDDVVPMPADTDLPSPVISDVQTSVPGSYPAAATTSEGHTEGPSVPNPPIPLSDPGQGSGEGTPEAVESSPGDREDIPDASRLKASE